MPWGKHFGLPVNLVPSGYLVYALENWDMGPALRAEMRRVLALRLGLGVPPPAPPPRLNLGEEVKDIYQSLCLRWHPDRGGSTEPQQALNDFYDKLRRLTG
jgi:hypothetical protein